MKKRINSRQKGARMEREAAAFLTGIGYPTTREARNGVDGAEDLVLPPELSYRVHIEVKADESIDIGTKALTDAFEQAKMVAKGRNPYVLWHRKRRGWRLSWVDTFGVMHTVAEDDIATALRWVVTTEVK